MKQKQSERSSKNNELQTRFVTSDVASGSHYPGAEKGHERPEWLLSETELEALPNRGASCDLPSVARKSQGASTGLVSFKTSSTTCSTELVAIDTAESRIKKMRQSVTTAARLIEEGLQTGGFRYRAAMLTVTYAEVDGWSSDHISQLMHHIRMYLRRRGHKLVGVRVAELQKRGAVHYHILIWLPRGITLPKPDKQGWWPHGMTELRWARRAIGYLIKYASKVESKHKFPKGCRISGVFGLNKEQRMRRRWWRMPAYVRARWDDWRDDVVRAPGGGFLARATAEYMPPLYGLLAITGKTVYVMQLDAPEWRPYLLSLSKEPQQVS